MADIRGKIVARRSVARASKARRTAETMKGLSSGTGFSNVSSSFFSARSAFSSGSSSRTGHKEKKTESGDVPATYFSARSAFSSDNSSHIGHKEMKKEASFKKQIVKDSKLTVKDSDYYRKLGELDLLVSPKDELNWSGRPPGSGQHVEFDLRDDIPLEYIRLLGESRSARVEAVKCRRISLARKTMKLNRRLTLAEVMNEVQHLHRLRHPNIVKLIGSYLQGKTFAVLIYPVANWHLGEFLTEVEKILLNDSTDFYDFLKVQSLPRFIHCLQSALCYIHSKEMKHMDIKPANILVKEYPRDVGFTDRVRGYHVLVADFGISRSFISQEHSQTKTLVAMTPKYCSPEVYQGLEHGRAADVFSLGAVFIEIFTVLCYRSLDDFADHRNNELGDAYCHNVDQVFHWIEELSHIRPAALSESDGSHMFSLRTDMVSKTKDHPKCPMDRHSAALRLARSMLDHDAAYRPVARLNPGFPLLGRDSLQISADVDLSNTLLSNEAWIAAASHKLEGYGETSLMQLVVDSGRSSVIRLVLSSNNVRLEVGALERALHNGCTKLEELAELGIPLNAMTIVCSAGEDGYSILRFFLEHSYNQGLTETSVHDTSIVPQPQKYFVWSLTNEVLDMLCNLAKENLEEWVTCLSSFTEVDSSAKFVMEMLKGYPAGMDLGPISVLRKLCLKISIFGSPTIQRAFAEHKFYQTFQPEWSDSTKHGLW